MSTFPFCSNTAVAPLRAVPMAAVVVQAPLAALYSSAPSRVPVSLRPPATSTLASGRRVAVCARRAMLIPPVAMNVSAARAGIPVNIAVPASSRKNSTERSGRISPAPERLRRGFMG